MPGSVLGAGDTINTLIKKKFQSVKCSKKHTKAKK